MPLQETSGNVTADAYGGGVAAVPNYIEDVFSTYLYTGTGSGNQSITNNIDLSGKGGLVWIKGRATSVTSNAHVFFDTVRGREYGIQSINTNQQQTSPAGYDLISFDSSGFTVSANNYNWVLNPSGSASSMASWTFRKQPKFFDVVTYTGNGVDGRAISHNLGAIPRFIIVKRTDAAAEWRVYAYTPTGPQSFYLALNTTGADGQVTGGYVENPTLTQFQTYAWSGDISTVNASGGTYVAYLFASNAGGFGLTGTDNVISCGSFTTDGSGNATVNLGYEPQWLMTKTATTSSSGSWYMQDNMRGWVDNNPGSNDNKLIFANTSAAETGGGFASLNATGFTFSSGGYAPWASQTFIYIAIRRGPMKVPTDATKVFGITTAAGTSPAYVSSFPVDVALRYQITGGDPTLQSRLTGAKKMYTDYNFAEGSNDANLTWDYQNGMFTTTGANANQYGWLIRRAPSYMDEVCYTGDSTTPRTVTHNLGVAPELMIVKCRSNDRGWAVYSSGIGAGKYLILNGTNAALTDTTIWANTAPTSSVFTVGDPYDVNNTGYTYVAYLFATCAGVSKVGSYTGNGSTQTINCGFTGGARFVLIKRTDSTGGWYVYDTSRGMTTLTDPYFFLNDSAAQVATLGSVTTVTTGFAVNASILAAINTNGASYIYLSIA